MPKGTKGFVKGGTDQGSKDGISNSEKNRPARDALHRVLTQENGKRLRAVAEALVREGESGNVAAIKEIYERTDGKVKQEVDAVVDQNVVIELVRFSDDS